MVSGTDLDVLKGLGELGGKAHVKAVAAKAGLRTPYAEMICYGLGRSDYLDMAASGICELTPKGYQALRAKGWRSTDSQQGEETGQEIGPIGAERRLSGLRQRMERGEITEEDYRQERGKIIASIARGYEGE
ncbi:MAG: hypothetical protein Q8O86_01105 [Dehalococcoidia bacterium]|nr:hypothetical protein [Dehalococcoidia bacterium]